MVASTRGLSELRKVQLLALGNATWPTNDPDSCCNTNFPDKLRKYLYKLLGLNSLRELILVLPRKPKLYLREHDNMAGLDQD